MTPKLFRIRPQADENAPADPTLVLINKEQAEALGIELDEVGFPTLNSLEEWHRANNPQLFADGKKTNKKTKNVEE